MGALFKHGSNLYLAAGEATSVLLRSREVHVAEGRGRTLLVVGGGVFGLTAALELRRRGWRVRLLDVAPLPTPGASSTDISKAVRQDYGADAFYTDLAGEAIEGWRAWNARFGETLYREVGFLLMRRSPFAPGTFEGDSYEMLRARGCPVERLDREALRRRFPAWNAELYVDGYFNPRAGWVPSARVVSLLADEARAAGVVVHEARSLALVDSGDRVTGVRTASGESLTADCVLVACGAWTPVLLPELSQVLRPVAQPVVHLAPADAGPYRAPHFPVWAADISATGWYGFPATPEGIVKIGNHGPGHAVEPTERHELPERDVERCREFLRGTFPALAEAPLVGGRLCFYCDTPDGDFWIDRHPERAGLVVAAGGSGHGFKFAPVLGRIIANVVEGRPDPHASRFAWRTPRPRHAEHARFHGQAGSSAAPQ